MKRPNTVSSESDPDPFQLSSLSDQNKCTVSSDSPHSAQQKDKKAACNSSSETGTEATPCKSDEKLQLCKKQAKPVCRKCNQQQISISYDQPENSHLNENKSGLLCFCALLEDVS